MHVSGKILAVSVTALLAVAGSAQSQTLRNDDGPAEFPPASYTEAQYVDSRGCVYVRAGFGDNVNWVPRVNRSREVLCGYDPTFGGGRAVDAVPVIADVEETPAPVPTPEPATTPPLFVETTTPPPSIIAPPVVQPEVVVTAPPVAEPVVVAPPVVAAGGCTGASELSAQYLQTRRGYAVRCGPQATPPSGGAGGTVNVIRVPRPPEVTPPPGYRAAFDDDRLNPYRGQGTAVGRVQMALVWTDTVPRRLVDANTGTDVTARFPNLVYPYTDPAIQVRTTGGDVIVATRDPSEEILRARAPNRTPDPEPAPEPQYSGHQYVQIGAFSTEDKARDAARRIQAVGLPVRFARMTRGGQSYQLVLAGPFNTASSLQAGLSKVRGVGYTSATTR